MVKTDYITTGKVLELNGEYFTRHDGWSTDLTQAEIYSDDYYINGVVASVFACFKGQKGKKLKWIPIKRVTEFQLGEF